MHHLIVITDSQSKCCHVAVIRLGTKTSIISDQEGYLQVAGKAGNVQTRNPGPAWSCVITRCLLATLLSSSTAQEKCYLPETQDFSYLCNYKPRRKANNAVCLLQNPFWKSRGFNLALRKFSNSAILLSAFEDANPERCFTQQ